MALLSYGLRATTKTSPLSTLTTTLVIEGDEARQIDTFSVEVSVLRAVLDALRRVHGSDLPLRLNPTLSQAKDRSWRCFDRRGVVGGATRLIGLGPSPLIDLVVAHMQCTGPMAQADLLRLVQNSLGPEGARFDVASVLAALVNEGLLTPSVGASECQEDALDRVLAAMRSAGLEGAAEFPILLQCNEALLATRGAVNGSEVSLRERELSSALADLAALHPEVEERVGASKTSLQHERTVLGGRTPVLAQSAREDLARLVGILPLFDSLEGDRQYLSARFKRLRCASLEGAELLDFLVHAADDRAGQGEGSVPEADPGVDTARREILDAMSVCGKADERTRHLAEAELHRWSRLAQPLTRGRAATSVSFLAQPSTTPSETTGDIAGVVLNGIHAGYGMLSARYLEHSDTARERHRERLAALASPGIPVELTGGFGHWGQRRPLLTREVIDHPGEESPSSRGRSVPWSSLRLSIDGSTGHLILTNAEDGVGRLPVHFGTLSVGHQPPVYRLLRCLGFGFEPVFDSVALLEARQSPTASGGFRRYPRVVHGSVVISRETWVFPADLFPWDAMDRDPVDGLFALRDWREELQIPRRVFLKPMSVAESAQRAAGRHRTRKPFLVDFDSPFSLRMLRRFLDRSGSTVHMSELLPELPGRGHRVREMLIEVTGGRV